jgi:hypothetical protein
MPRRCATRAIRPGLIENARGAVLEAKSGSRRFAIVGTLKATDPELRTRLLEAHKAGTLSRQYGLSHAAGIKTQVVREGADTFSDVTRNRRRRERRRRRKTRRRRPLRARRRRASGSRTDRSGDRNVCTDPRSPEGQAARPLREAAGEPDRGRLQPRHDRGRARSCAGVDALNARGCCRVGRRRRSGGRQGNRGRRRRRRTRRCASSSSTAPSRAARCPRDPDACRRRAQWRAAASLTIAQAREAVDGWVTDRRADARRRRRHRPRHRRSADDEGRGRQGDRGARRPLHAEAGQRAAVHLGSRGLRRRSPATIGDDRPREATRRTCGTFQRLFEARSEQAQEALTTASFRRDLSATRSAARWSRSTSEPSYLARLAEDRLGRDELDLRLPHESPDAARRIRATSRPWPSPGSYTALTSPTDEEATLSLSKKGNTETITLEMIANDDVGVIARIPQRLARAAKRTLYKAVFDPLRLNSATSTPARRSRSPVRTTSRRRRSRRPKSRRLA